MSDDAKEFVSRIYWRVENGEIAEAIEDLKRWRILDIRNYSFVESFNLLAEDAAGTAESKGWENPADDPPKFIALCHSELSEALEGFRHGDPPDDKIPEFTNSEAELADTIIRILHYTHKSKARVAQAVLAKLKFNKTRPHKHGGKKF